MLKSFYFVLQRMIGVILVICAVACANLANCQSNYASHGNNVEYQGEGLPEQTILDGKVTKLDDLQPVIFLNRTKAALNCVAGSMQVNRLSKQKKKKEKPNYYK